MKKYLDWFPVRFRELSHPAKLSLLVSALLVGAILMILTASHSKENALSTTNAQQVVSPTYYCGGSCPTNTPTTIPTGQCVQPSQILCPNGQMQVSATPPLCYKVICISETPTPTPATGGTPCAYRWPPGGGPEELYCPAGYTCDGQAAPNAPYGMCQPNGTGTETPTPTPALPVSIAPPPVTPPPGSPLDQLIQLIQQLIQQIQQLIQQLLGGGGNQTPAPTGMPTPTTIPVSSPPSTGAPTGAQGKGVVVDYSGLPLSVTADWSGTNSTSVQSGTSVSLTNFTIASSHPNQVIYLALVSKGATDLGNVSCVRAGDKFVQLQKSNSNGDTVYILYRGHDNLSVLPGSNSIDCSWDNSANVNLGASAFYNVDNTIAEFYHKTAPADTSSFPSVITSSTPGDLIFGWGGVGEDIPVAPANYISAYLLHGAQSVDLTSFTVGPGANEAMFVGITSPGPLNATVTWDGQALSLLDTYPVPGGMVGCNGNGPGCPTQAQLYWYFLTAPHPGNKVLNVTWTNTTSYYGEPIVDIGAVSFSGVNQATPFSSITHSSGDDGGGANPVDSITIPTAPGDETVALWGSIYAEGCSWNQTPNWPVDGHGINSLSSRAGGTSGNNTHSLHHGGPQCGIPGGGIWGMSGFNIKAQ
jgi:hypothetical protein